MPAATLHRPKPTLGRNAISPMTMAAPLPPTKPVDRNTHSKPGAETAAQPAKEAKMTKTVPQPAAGTPFGEKLAGFGRAVLPPALGMLILIGLWYIATMKGGSIPGPIQT